jgi:steroid delta-isomerase-like uncharacterized protein
MSVEENVVLMRRWFREVWNEGRMEAIPELMAKDAVGMGETEDGSPLRGPGEFTEFARRTRAAFPDIAVSIQDIFGYEDRVVIRWSASMTHKGEYFGLAPSNTRIKITGMSMAQLERGQIIAGWDNWDQLGLMKQLGIYQPQPVLAKTA